MISKYSLRIQIYLLLIVSSAFADQTVPTKRAPLPDLGKLNFDIDVKSLQNKTVLICFWDYNQRPSRRFVKELAILHDQLAQLNVPVLLIQTDPQSRESSKAWLDSQQINWPGDRAGRDLDRNCGPPGRRELQRGRQPGLGLDFISQAAAEDTFSGAGKDRGYIRVIEI